MKGSIMTNNKGKEHKMAKSARVLETVEQAPVVETPIALDEKGRMKVVNLSMEEVEAKGWKNKSQIIRGLDGLGYSRSAIANFLGIRYQFVRNVLITPLKKG